MFLQLSLKHIQALVITALSCRTDQIFILPFDCIVMVRHELPLRQVCLGVQIRVHDQGICGETIISIACDDKAPEVPKNRLQHANSSIKQFLSEVWKTYFSQLVALQFTLMQMRFQHMLSTIHLSFHCHFCCNQLLSLCCRSCLMPVRKIYSREQLTYLKFLTFHL